MNHLEGVRELHNNYFFLRHGRSIANHNGVIISDPYVATDHFGLMLNGTIEARFSIRRARTQGFFDETRPTVIFTSDFRRHKETALIAQSELGDEIPIFESKKLRERYFGRWEGKSNRYYEDVWEEDAKDARSNKNGVESVDDVLDRMTSLICEVEEKYKDNPVNVLFVSSGDPLDIALTPFLGLDPRRHREVKPLRTGEIRQVFLAKQPLQQHVPE